MSNEVDLLSLKSDRLIVKKRDVSSVEVYGEQVLLRGIPEGYRFNDFRLPQIGEWILKKDGTPFHYVGGHLEEPGQRIILHRFERRRVIEFVETGENRIPNRGEWFLAGDGGLKRWSDVDSARPIFKRTESFKYVDPKEGANE
jgi:hypothetical protein